MNQAGVANERDERTDSGRLPLAFPVASDLEYRSWYSCMLTEQLEMTEPWSSVDVAQHLGGAHYSWIKTRGLLAHKSGRILKFKLSKFDAWIRVGGTDGDEQVKSKTKTSWGIK